MSIGINSSRLKIARSRRKMSLKALSEATDLTTRIISAYENGKSSYVPKPETITAIANALKYPESFFTKSEDMDILPSDTVSFRSLKSMKAKDEQAAISAGSIGVDLFCYFESLISFIPTPNIPDLRGMQPAEAADFIREYWDIGALSISNMVHLLEKNGVRVLTLAENTIAVDAFSFWRNNIPYVFLNTQKSGERSRFDAAHELGHLVMHKHGSPQGRDVEKEADEFAAHLLMPSSTIASLKGRIFTVDDVISFKKKWKVSAMGLIVHSKNLGIITEWQYRNLIIDASKLGLRKKEIDGIPHENSGLIPVMLKEIKRKTNKDLVNIANDLSLPLTELTNLIFKATQVIENKDQYKSNAIKPNLYLVR